MYSLGELMAALPKVGDVRTETPTVYATAGLGMALRQPQPCRVVLVNREHLWYTVEFEHGYRETYKLPKVREAWPGAKK